VAASAASGGGESVGRCLVARHASAYSSRGSQRRTVSAPCTE
jgi:hypothetical protein